MWGGVLPSFVMVKPIPPRFSVSCLAGWAHVRRGVVGQPEELFYDKEINPSDTAGKLKEAR
jgi:hypothetical protein